VKIFPNEAFGYWKVVVERPVRLQRLTVKAMESLRFASGDEVRSMLYDQLGEPLFENFARVEVALEGWLTNGAAAIREESKTVPRQEGLPEKKKKLLHARTWERDARLVEAASALREELGIIV
jgi:type I restriction enzyme M protein